MAVLIVPGMQSQYMSGPLIWGPPLPSRAVISYSHVVLHVDQSDAAIGGTSLGIPKEKITLWFIRPGDYFIRYQQYGGGSNQKHYVYVNGTLKKTIYLDGNKLNNVEIELKNLPANAEVLIKSYARDRIRDVEVLADFAAHVAYKVWHWDNSWDPPDDTDSVSASKDVGAKQPPPVRHMKNAATGGKGIFYIL